MSADAPLFPSFVVVERVQRMRSLSALSTRICMMVPCFVFTSCSLVVCISIHSSSYYNVSSSSHMFFVLYKNTDYDCLIYDDESSTHYTTYLLLTYLSTHALSTHTYPHVSQFFKISRILTILKRERERENEILCCTWVWCSWSTMC